MKKMITQSLRRDSKSSLKTQVWSGLGLFLMLMFSTALIGQGDCLNEESWPPEAVAVDPSGAETTISTIMYNGGEWSEVSGILSGEDYLFDHTVSTYVTVRIGSFDGPILAQGAAPLLVTANSEDNLFPHWNLDEECGVDLSGTAIASVQCASCEPSGPDETIVDCEQGGVEEFYCYDNNESSEFTYVSSDGSPLLISFSLGFLESCCDDIFIYAGDSDEAPLMNEGETAGDFAGRSYNTAAFNEASSILVVFSSDGSGSCQDGLWGVPQDGANWEVLCSDVITCEAPELGLAAFEIGGQTPIESCLDEGTPWIVSLGISGGSGNSAYDVILNGEPTGQQVFAGGSTTVGGLFAGDVANIQLVGADDPNCSVEGSIETELCPPANDLCADAIPVVCGETIAGTNLAATNNGAPTESCGTIPGSSGVWYSWTGDGSIVTATTCNEGTNFDTKLNVYSGSCEELVCVAGDDDGSPSGENPDPACVVEETGSTANRASTVPFESEEGVTYYFYVSGFGSAQGNFELSIICEEPPSCEPPSELLAEVLGNSCDSEVPTFDVEVSLSQDGTEGSYLISNDLDDQTASIQLDGSAIFTFPVGSAVEFTASNEGFEDCSIAGSAEFLNCPPANDEPCAAIALACNQPVEGTNLGATESGLDPTCAGGSLADVFYSISAEPGFIYTLTINGDDYDGVLALYAGNCDLPEELEELACADNGFTAGVEELIEFEVEEATEILVQTYDWSASAGSFVISLACEEVVACENTEYNLVVDGGTWAGEVSWNLLLDGEIVVDGGAPISGEVLCLADGCYTLELFDSFGDGWNGNEFSLSIGDEVIAGPFTLEDGEEGIAEFGLGDVVCGEPACENYEYYIADILEDGITNIYEVSINGSDAELSWIATSEYEVHIALNESNGLLYAVSKADGSFRTLDPATGVFGSVEMLDLEVSEIIGATFNADGKLMISSQSENAIYSVMLGSNEVSVFDSYSPILGGDIDFGQDGALYLATREGFGTFYLAIPDGVAADELKGDAPQLVTGLADTESGQLLFSHRDATTLEVRDYDGTVQDPLNILLDGEPFMTFNGDLASGCADNRQDLEECEQVIYYTNQPPGASDYTLYSVELNGDGTSTSTELLSGLGSSHIGVTPDGSTIYIVGGSDLITYDVESEAIVNTINIVSEGGANLSGFPACLVAEDGTLYIGGNGDNVYTVEPATGDATLFTSDYDVNGGDLIEAPTGEGGALELWLITRNNNTFTRLSDGVSFPVPVPEINGAAVLENGNVLLANGDGDAEDAFIEVSLADASIVDSYDAEYLVNNGDLAATCVDPDPNTSNPCIAEGACNAVSAIYVEGTTNNGGSLSAARSNPDNALGAPQGTDALVFTSLGYGGSLTFEFDGVVPNGEGDDLIVVETSYGNPGCESYPEYADVSVSADGEDFYYIGTVCKSDNAVDISDAEIVLDCVSYVRVASNDGLTSTPDAFDVDGIIAIHNCAADDDNDGEEAGIIANEDNNNTLSSFPNPTSGLSQAVFVTGQTERATLEVYDMNGRLVEGLFSGMAEAGVEYRIDFDGLALPNGVYMYRLTTDSETIVDKFMIAR